MLQKCSKPSWFLGLALLVLVGCSSGGGSSSEGDQDTPPIARITSAEGRVLISPMLVMDGDINDPAAPRSPNDTYANAQSVSVPITISGYVNTAGFGPPGASYASGDERDIYVVEFDAGAVISLHSDLDNPKASLSLELRSEQDPTVLSDALIDVSTSGTLTVPERGRYYVLVEISQGAATYILALGDDGKVPATPDSALRLSDAFVPGQAIVALQPEARSRSTLRHGAELPKGIALLKDNGARTILVSTTAGERKLANSGTPTTKPAGEVLVQAKLETLEAVKALRRTPGIAAAELNHYRHIARAPNDPQYPHQWHYSLIGLPDAWAAYQNAARATEVVVGVIDTGILKAHPDLKNVTLDDGYDFVSNDPLDGDGPDPDPTEPGRSDSIFHGTHVAGTVAAHTDNGVGVAGVAWDAKLLPIRALGAKTGTSYDIQQALLYAGALLPDSKRRPIRPADIVNLSFAGPSPNRFERDAIAALRAKGVIVVAAAGNDATNLASYPAAYPGVVGVSAVDAGKSRAWYSNYGYYIDVAAPGGVLERDADGDGREDGILSTSGLVDNDVLTYGYDYLNGTSMAAPHVSGVAALMKAVYPKLTPEDFDRLLAAGLLTSPCSGQYAMPLQRDDLCGYGLIDAARAVSVAHRLAQGEDVLAGKPLLLVQPSVLDFGTHGILSTISIDDLSGRIHTPIQIDGQPKWMDIRAVQVDQNGLGRHRLTIDRGRAEAGALSADLTIRAGEQRTQLRISARKPTAPPRPASDYYVLLVDALSQQVVAQGRLTADDKGTFAFPDVPSGSYYIYAGSDNDNDGFICEWGELCGSQSHGASRLPGSAGDIVISVQMSQLRNADNGAGERSFRPIPRLH